MTKRIAIVTLALALIGGFGGLGCTYAVASDCCNSSCPPPSTSNQAQCCAITTGGDFAEVAPATIAAASHDAATVPIRFAFPSISTLHLRADLSSIDHGSAPDPFSRLCSRQI